MSEFTVKAPLSPSLRKQLERAIVSARDVAEAGARAALESLAVHEREPYRHMSAEQRALRNRLRAHGRQVGDRRHASTGRQEIDHLVHECAYEHWHGMLFARFLAENDLLIEPNTGVAVTLEECEELAQEEGLDRWTLASRYAHRMLPQVFRPDHPAFEVRLAREHRLKLEQLVEELPSAVFDATDSLGWVYQFWQSREKTGVNSSEVKIGANELPAVTQLFTEPYMVRFLLDNSLGAWWVARRLTDSDLSAAESEAALRRMAALPGMSLDYLRFVRPAESAGQAPWRPAAGAFRGWPDALGDLKILDPCCGSGHFLVAAFAMLVPMRMAQEGLAVRAAVDAVLRDNLYGLELDPRCVAVAAFALALAAWRWPGTGGYRPLPQLNLACSGLAPNATREEWSELAERAAAAGGMPPERDLFEVDDTLLSAQLRGSLDALHDLFRQAPTLGSLIDPRSLQVELFQGGYESVRELFAAVVAREGAPEQTERAVAAQGMARAAELLAGRYHLVLTNVPYLARGKQDQALRDFCERHHDAAKNDLATVFLERCLSLCADGGTAGLVMPQNWLFLSGYRKLREKLLKTQTWHVLARLGPGAFETISGEVVKAVLLTLSRSEPAAPPPTIDDLARRLLDQTTAARSGSSSPDAGGLLNLELGIHEVFSNVRGQVMQRLREEAARASPPQPDAAGIMYGLDVSEYRTAGDKAAWLRDAEVGAVAQANQLRNPDARVTLVESTDLTLLADFAEGVHGFGSKDSPAFFRQFWELVDFHNDWQFLQTTVDRTRGWAGCEQAVFWQQGRGILAERGRVGQAIPAGGMAWGKAGVAVSQMRTIPCALYTGEIFDKNVAVISPVDGSHLPAVWCFCSSPDYHDAVRRIDQKLNVTNATLVKVPFDVEYWTSIAEARYPNGLPEPYSDDPTQWIFHGHPCGSVVWDETGKRTVHGPLRTDSTVLQVAVARLLGCCWPAERDDDMELADEQIEWVRRCATLRAFADEDGIVCLPSAHGERSAAERLLSLLAAAFGDAWSDATLRRLLASVASPGLDDWLRNRFFEQHCKLFRHRPFLWHVWDGRRRDGFHALVAYHKLAAGDDRGRQLLESLTYSYLGDWIARQRDDVQRSATGAEDRLVAALELQRRLAAILEGEPPYDIFVRWKPLDDQPIGWEPDIDDGVRLNIRPFMAADISGGRKGAGILRAKPNLHWRKDRGKEPLTSGQQSKPPWLQDDDDWDGDVNRELRPRDDYPWFWSDGEFTGDRVNDVHLTIAEKHMARSRKAPTETD